MQIFPACRKVLSLFHWQILIPLFKGKGSPDALAGRLSKVFRTPRSIPDGVLIESNNPPIVIYECHRQWNPRSMQTDAADLFPVLSQTRMNASAPAVIKKRWSELKDILLTVVLTSNFVMGPCPSDHRQMLIFDFCSFADRPTDSSCEVTIQWPSELKATLRGCT